MGDDGASTPPELDEYACGVPRRIFTSNDVATITVKDHEGADVRIAWYSNDAEGCPRYSIHDPGERPDDLPPFAFQVYILVDAAETAKDTDFPIKFVCALASLGAIPPFRPLSRPWTLPRYRFDVHIAPQRSLLSCVGHQRREVAWRNSNRVWPCLLPRWTSHPDRGYNGVIFVVNRDTWSQDGFCIVRFDPAEYVRPNSFPDWTSLNHGDIDVVRADRQSHMGRFHEVLDLFYRLAGGDSVQAHLERMNSSSANGPSAHPDVELADLLSEPATLADTHGQSTAFNSQQRITSTFNRDDLWISFAAGTAPPSYRRDQYQDTDGTQVVSIWDGRHSTLRPSFSFSLYLSRSVFGSPEALFHCLNKGLIADVPWTLDVRRNVNNLEGAEMHHDLETLRRTRTKVEQRSRCMRMLLRRIAGSSLPNELLETIEESLVPPEIPSYTAVPSETHATLMDRDFQNFFLHFAPTEGAKSKADVPILVYSKPLPRNEAVKALCACGKHAELPSNGLEPRDRVVKAINLRYWHRIADELHTIWSLSAPRNQILLESISVPEVTMNIKVRTWKERLSDWPGARRNTIRTIWEVRFGLMLRYDQPITIHSCPFFSRAAWEQCLELFDMTDDKVIPIPHMNRSTPASLPWHSWHLTPELGFPNTIPDPASPHNWSPLLTLQPGREAEVPPYYLKRNVAMLVDLQPTLQPGHEYAVRLQPGITLTRWTFGTALERHGPYNLPPLPVTMGKEDRFTHTGD